MGAVTISRLRVVAATCAAVACLAAVGVSESHAYRLGGEKWPTRTITYHSTATRYADAIRTAVQAWNTSGVRIRFRPTSKRRAMLQIVYGRFSHLGAAGLATLGWAARDAVTRREIAGVEMRGYPVPCGMRMRAPVGGGTARVRCHRGPHVWLARVGPRAADDPRVQNSMINTVAHELGHVLGLKHVWKRCAVMAGDGRGRCSDPPHPWQVRCRALEADDIKGAISRYGGRMRPLAQPFCEGYSAPVPPGDLAASFDAEKRLVAVTWTNAPSPSLAQARLAIERDACPTEPVYQRSARPRASGSLKLPADVDGGRFCIAVWSEDEFGRLSPPATTWIDVAPEPAPPPQSEPDPERDPEPAPEPEPASAR